jgi:hypothetical protein
MVLHEEAPVDHNFGCIIKHTLPNITGRDMATLTVSSYLP